MPTIYKHVTSFFFLLLSCVTQSQLDKGERQLSISITEASDKNYDYAFTLAKDAGMQVTGFSLTWDELELAPYEYADDPNWLQVINDFFLHKILLFH